MSESLNLFPGLEFQHLKNPPAYWTRNPKDGRMYNKGRACDVCAMPVQGSLYHCCGKPSVDVHETCAQLNETIDVGVDDAVFKLKKGKAESDCIWCSSSELKGSRGNIEGFRYESLCGRYTFHVFCLRQMQSSGRRPKPPKKTPRSKKFREVVEKFLLAVLRVLVGDPTAIVASVLVQIMQI